jgi:hypothetical protein
MEKDSAAQQHKGAVVLQGHLLGPFRSASGEKNSVHIVRYKSIEEIMNSQAFIIT